MTDTFQITDYDQQAMRVDRYSRAVSSLLVAVKYDDPTRTAGALRRALTALTAADDGYTAIYGAAYATIRDGDAHGSAVSWLRAPGRAVASGDARRFTDAEQFLTDITATMVAYPVPLSTAGGVR